MTVTTRHEQFPPIIRFEAGHAARWGAFIDDSLNGTLFHRLEFLDYHPAGRFQWHHLVIGNPGTPLALLPAAETRDDVRGRVLCSPAGATFGGLVVGRGLGLRQTTALLRSVVDYARSQKFAEVILGTVPRIYWRVPDDTLEFALREIGFERSSELCHFVDLTAIPWPNLVASIPGSSRQRMRKAQHQQLQFSVVDDPDGIAEFYRVLTANKQQHGAKPVHTLDELCDLKQTFSDQIRFYVTKKDDTILGGVYCVLANRRVAYTQYIADDPAFRHLEATRYTFARMFELLHRESIHFVDLGPSATLPVKKTSLARFKESLGAAGVERNQWRLRLTP